MECDGPDALARYGVIQDASEGDVISIRIGTTAGEIDVMAFRS